jgi:hypothetical protein
MYGISQVITVPVSVPEPSTPWLAGTAMVVVTGYPIIISFDSRYLNGIGFFD